MVIIEKKKLFSRKSIRLKGYDYSKEGVYHITVATVNRECMFGNIINGEMFLNDSGDIIQQEWTKTPVIRPNIRLDEFVIMPNHIHGIIIIEYSMGRGVLQYAPTKFQSPSQTIGAIVRGFKSTVTKQINTIRNTPLKQVWQRNYYEQIIQTDADLNRVREYIVNNPKQWNNEKQLAESKACL